MNTPIHITVQTSYIAAQSRPDIQRFVYSYTITITNHSDTNVQLISRHWRIKDANDNLQEVKGLGVVGEQPRLAPGASYTYTSGAILETETGMMEGSYQMRRDDGSTFDTPIPLFALVPPHAMH
ncbi:Co2+/Mg2+ efflux protein ApaG [Cellvibrio sp. ARAG 10.3]|jgi:ApaG protein|uniref:Co2+/Mg2+ efflux protein ApaG n=1 Tax=Cellvibrio sp. ARAG 10.3 TaxID=3451358 RepID=UPI003F45ED8C